VARQNALEDLNLLEPGAPLGPGEVEIVLPGHSRKDLVAVGCTEFHERGRVVGPLGGGAKRTTLHKGLV